MAKYLTTIVLTRRVLVVEGEIIVVIPDFVDGYHLPGYEHECTIEEIESKFLNTSERVRVWGLFKGLLFRLETLGLTPDVLLIDGSFVTGREAPGDVDFGALIKPDAVRRALSKFTDKHDREAIIHFGDPSYGEIIRELYGAHMIVVKDNDGLVQASRLFRKGGTYRHLRDPDPVRDPAGVTRPKQKGILRVTLNPQVR